VLAKVAQEGITAPPSHGLHCFHRNPLHEGVHRARSPNLNADPVPL
jgi:hypothetical protein